MSAAARPPEGGTPSHGEDVAQRQEGSPVSAGTLVLLHGWGLTPRIWDGLRAALPPAAEVSAPPLPGHADAPPSTDSDLARWGDALLAGIPDGSTLCGWSLGGSIALDLALRRPEKVARLILIGSSACFVARPDARDPWPHGLDEAIVAGFIGSYADDPAATLRRFIALQTVGDARRRAVGAALADALSPIDGHRATALAGGLNLLADTDLRAKVAALHRPALLIHGAGDALMPLAGAEWLAARLPRATLARFDDCGHAPFLSRPAECARLIEDFALA